ncbi:MAG TPA: hypothetical protein VE524_10760 [Nitrososphaeraceae archaeon]|nr:hypothetical protein [Nitrososphaeraceae archaeon]
MASNHFIININSMELPHARTNTILRHMDRSYNRNLWSIYGSNKTLSGFFFKPKLSIEYNNLPDTNIEQNTMPYGNTRRFLKLIVRNTGKGIAENCEALLTFQKTDNNRPPSTETKNLMWDNSQEFRSIGAKKGEAILHIVFSDSTFSNLQIDYESGKTLEENMKTYAKISTIRSFSNLNPNVNPYVQDGIGIGNTDFKLKIQSLDSSIIEKTIRIKVSQNWQDLSMELLD